MNVDEGPQEKNNVKQNRLDRYWFFERLERSGCVSMYGTVRKANGLIRPYDKVSDSRAQITRLSAREATSAWMMTFLMVMKGGRKRNRGDAQMLPREKAHAKV